MRVAFRIDVLDVAGDETAPACASGFVDKNDAVRAMSGHQQAAFKSPRLQFIDLKDVERTRELFD